MTLVLTGKGLVLGGWPSKLEVIWVLGIYTSYLHECSGWNKIPYITALAQPFLSVLKQKPPIWSPLFLRVVSPQNLANCWCSEFRPSYLRKATSATWHFWHLSWWHVSAQEVSDRWRGFGHSYETPKKSNPGTKPPRWSPNPDRYEWRCGASIQMGNWELCFNPIFWGVIFLLITGFRPTLYSNGGGNS